MLSGSDRGVSFIRTKSWNNDHMLKQLAGVPPSVSITDQIVEAAKTVAGTAKSAADSAKAAAAQANGDSEKEKMAQEAEKAAQVSPLKFAIGGFATGLPGCRDHKSR